MRLVTVTVKKSKIRATFPYWGGVLNPEARYYVRRITSKTNPQAELRSIVKELSHEHMQSM